MIDRPLYVEKIMAYSDTPFVKILTGVLRCGKSTILRMIMEKLRVERGIPKERVVNSLLADFDVDLYVTESNSRMMSSEISTYLTGRYVAFRIYTLSFGEYLTFKKRYAPLENQREELAAYIRLGGFPAVHLREYSQEEVLSGGHLASI